jgi:undecaprenyl-diphosphatase
VIESALWGLVQGLTEFLPVSSSGHLVLIPALFDREGPDLAVSAVLHLGTLAAVLAYYRRDVARMLSFDRDGRRLLWLLVVGTIPAAAVGFFVRDPLDRFSDDPDKVAMALVVTGAVLVGSALLHRGRRLLPDGGPLDAIVVGIAQACALVPGISRSGMTITAALGRRFTRHEAARFAFLLGIPAIAGAGLLEAIDLADAGGLRSEVWVGALVAGVSGYFAIGFLLRILERVGLAPFGIYCVAFGVFSLVVV